MNLFPKCIFSTGLLAISLCSWAQQVWSPLSVPVTEGLFGVSFLNSDTGFVCGGSLDRSLILKTEDGGSSWSTFSRNESDFLYDMAMPAPGILVAGGYNGVMLRSTDWGQSWNVRPSSTSGWLYDFYFLDSDTGYCAGTGGTLIKTTDAGNTWVVKNTGTSDWLMGVHFTSASTGFVAGENGKIRKTTNYGDAWNVMENNDPNFLMGLAFIHPDTGFAVGFGGTILKTVDAGEHWFKISAPTIADLHGITFYSPKHAYISGDNVILHSSDAGNSWTLMNCPVNQQLYKIGIAGDSLAYIAGKNGTVLRTGILTGTGETDIFPEIRLFPNPVSEVIHLEWSGLFSGDTRIRVLNSLGGLVWESEVAQTVSYLDIDCIGWTSGIYTVQFLSEGDMREKKIVRLPR